MIQRERSESKRHDGEFERRKRVVCSGDEPAAYLVACEGGEERSAKGIAVVHEEEVVGTLGGKRAESEHNGVGRTRQGASTNNVKLAGGSAGVV